jgi:hypothetical protein
MAKDPINELAWESCKFCAQDDKEIMALIKDRTWAQLPLQYSCAWSRICTATARARLNVRDTRLWSDLCTARSDVNNELGSEWSQANWREKKCSAYEKAQEARTTGNKGALPGGAAKGGPAMAARPVGASWFGSFNSDGVPVTAVARGTLVYLSDVRSHDIIVSVGGKAVNSRAEFDQLMASVPVGQLIRLVLQRDGKMLHVNVRRPAR